MAKIPIILEAGRADGKLITTSAVFDENKSMFQSEINDIQDTLTSDNPNKPLSAKQGKVLKELLDAKVIEVGAVPIDSEPIEGNITHVVNSDGLAKEFNKCNTEIILGGVYDVSAHNNGTVFESLSSLLSNINLDALIPLTVRKGGMSIKFIQGSVPNSDNNYVRYNLMADEFTIDITKWAIADEGVYVENPEFIYVKADKDNKILWAIKTDGSIYYGAGVPSQIIDYINEKIAELPLDEYEDIVAFLNDYLGSDTTLKALIDSKLDAEAIENPEFIYVKTDAEGKILCAIKTDGEFFFGAGCPQQVKDYVEDIVTFLSGYLDSDTTLKVLIDSKLDAKGLDSNALKFVQAIENPEFLEATTDAKGNILEGISSNGVKKINIPIDISGIVIEHTDDNPEWISMTTDNEGKILEGISSDGIKQINIPVNTPKIETKELVLLENGIEKLKEDLDIQTSNKDVISIHLDKECLLYAMAYNYPFFYYPGYEGSGIGAKYKKRLVFGWISDVHGGEEEYGRFVEYSNHYKDVIDFMLVTGDLSKLAPRDGGWHDTQDKFAPLSQVPILICLGNHDVTGNGGYEVIYDSLKEMDDELFMPWATQIGWTNKGAGSYYYKDFINNDSGYKYRVIILNDYERPRLVADGSWETIDFDSTLPAYSSETSYVTGDKVNLSGHSYKAVKSVSGIAPSRTYFDYIDGRYISETQALWLCDALSSMPEGCKAIICSHMRIGHTTSISGNFTYSNGNTLGFEMSQNGYVVQDIINTFISKTSISKTYEMTKRMSSGRIDGEIIEGFSYTLNYDFSNISENIDIKCCLTGHSHIDMVTKLTDVTEKDVYNIMITQGVAQFQLGDLGNFGKRGKDAFNIISVDKNIGLKMIRIGSDVTQDFVKRDNIIINI